MQYDEQKYAEVTQIAEPVPFFCDH